MGVLFWQKNVTRGKANSPHVLPDQKSKQSKVTILSKYKYLQIPLAGDIIILNYMIDSVNVALGTEQCL